MPRPVSFLGRESAVPVSGRCCQGPDRVPGADQVGGPGPVRAQVQPAFPLTPGQAAGYVQQPEPQQLRALYRARTRAVALSWCSCARQAALRYSLINPWTTFVRLIQPVMSTGWQGSCSGGRCSRDWCGRCSL